MRRFLLEAHHPSMMCYLPYTSIYDTTMPRNLGVTSVQILGAIRDGAAFGLDIVTRTGLPSGTVYPTLSRLRKRQLIKPTWEDQRIAEREGRPRRRYYTLTPAGQEELAESLSRLRALTAELVPKIDTAL